MLKRKSMRFVAVILAALAGLVAGPNAALDAAHRHHDQQPGFYRLKVGDLEVTAVYGELLFRQARFHATLLHLSSLCY